MKRVLNPNIITLVAVGALTLLWPSLRVQAFNPQPDPPVFGLIGIDPNETMRLNATCPNVSVNGIPAVACIVTLGFADIHGTMIKQTSYTINPGDSASLDLGASEVIFEPNRAEIQPVTTATQGLAVPSVEVFDVASGKTDVYLNPIPRLGSIER